MFEKKVIKIKNQFPSAEISGPDGLVSIDDDLSLECLFEAYSKGIFPWPDPEFPVLWFSPLQRGVLKFSQIHVPKSLKKLISKNIFSFSLNKSFSQVLAECAKAPRKDQGGTWIDKRIQRAFLDFHKAGYAHSLEVWSESQLVGGIYGVEVKGVFSGESMFYIKTGASKLALLRLIQFLNEQGLKWIDTQMVTTLLKGFGAEYIPKQQYLDLLETSHKTNLNIDWTPRLLPELDIKNDWIKT